MDETKIWYFAKFNILKNLSKKEIYMLEKSMEMKVVKKNQPIHFPEKQQKHIYFLKKGSIKIFKYDKNGKEVIKYILEPGNIFGELHVHQDSENLKEKAITEKDSLICFVDIELMQNIMRNNPAFSLSIHKLIGYQVKKLERCLESMLFKNSRTRIIDFLIDVAKEYGKEERDSYVMKNFFTKYDIAKLTATTQQTVSSTLQDLQLNNLINYNHNQLTISTSKLKQSFL